MMSEYFIARHGQSEWNVIGRIQGQTNTQLSPAGQRQSQYLRRVLQDQSLVEIHTSQLDRAINTAIPLAESLKIPIQSTRQLNELAFGELEGKFRWELDSEDQQIWDWWMVDPVQRVIPGGESYQDLYARVRVFLDNLLERKGQGPVLIVGHLRVNQMLLGCFAGLTLRESISIRQPNNWLYHFSSGNQIRGAEIPTRPGEKLRWKKGLLYQPAG